VTIVFTCRACGNALTAPLVELPDGRSVCEKDAQSYVPRGFFVLSDGEYFTGTEGKYIVSLPDVLGTHRHSDMRRLSGCCGPDGCNGLQAVCTCGAEVGTEMADCWTAHALILEPAATALRLAT
jgi:hypothetical protein